MGKRGGQRDHGTGLTGRNRENHPRRVSARELSRKVLELRLTGLSFEKIGQALVNDPDIGRPVSTTTVKKAFARAMIVQRAQLEAAADEVRAIELARLDHMLARLWPAVNKGDEKSIDRAIKIGERRAKLLGLDAPAKVAPVNPAGDKPYQPHDVSPAQIAERVLELVERAKTRRASGHAPT